MPNVLVLDDNPIQLAWIANVVTSCFQGANFALFPREVNTNRRFQIHVPRRNGPTDDAGREAWASELLNGAGVADGSQVDIAIVDLCLTDPPQLRDPEGIWICSALRKRFPDCFIILVSSKSATDQPSISGGWFKYVPIPSVRIDEVVGIRDDDAVSSRSQLATAIRKSYAFEHA